MAFWLASIGLLVIALGVVALPILRRPKAVREGSHDVAVYKDQLAEIDRDLNSGLISDVEASGARTEIARRLLAADKRETTEKNRQSTGRRMIVAGLALTVVCGLSFGVYFGLGSPGSADMPLGPRLAKQKTGNPNIAQLVGRVEKHLAANPEDGKGWEVLAPIYFRMRRFDDAATAFANANRILGASAQRLADQGEALVSANRGIVSQAAREVFEKSLKLDKTAIKPRFFLAISLSQDGRLSDSLAAWKDLLKGVTGNSGWVKVARQQVAGLEAKLGLPPSTASNAPKSPGVVEKGPSSDDVASAAAMSPEDRQKMIEGMVSNLAERLESDGGTVDEWLRLIRAYSVLGKNEAAKAAVEKAQSAFENNPASLAKIKDLAGKLAL